jgi:hypothetical protein
MYARTEMIEEENLDWDMHPATMLEKMDAKITKIAMPSMSKEKKRFFPENIDLKGKFNVKKLTHFLDTNPELSLLFSMVTFPYIVGFFISYFLFYFYGGMSIESFLNIEKGNIHIEFWSIGAYIFITVGVIWAALTP